MVLDNFICFTLFMIAGLHASQDCQSWCNGYTCDMNECGGCSVCSGGYCSPWCNRWTTTFQSCLGCSGQPGPSPSHGSPPPACPPYESRNNYNVDGAPIFKGCAATNGPAYYNGWNAGGDNIWPVAKGLTLTDCVALCASTEGCVQAAFVKELTDPPSTTGCYRKDWNPQWMTVDADVVTVAGINCPLTRGARCTADSGSTNCGTDGFCAKANNPFEDDAGFCAERLPEGAVCYGLDGVCAGQLVCKYAGDTARCTPPKQPANEPCYDVTTRNGPYCSSYCLSGICYQNPGSQPTCREAGTSYAVLGGEDIGACCTQSSQCGPTEFCPKPNNPFEKPAGVCTSRIAEVGALCYGQEDVCVAGLTCKYNGNIASCQPKQPAGEPCYDATTQAAPYCSSYCASGICYKNPGSQPTCRRAGSSYAVLGGEDVGACCADDSECAPNEFCPKASNPFEKPAGVCTSRIAEVGALCYGQDVCVAGLTCKYYGNIASCQPVYG